VVTLDAGSIHGPHDIDARLRVGAIPDEIPQKRMMSASLFLRIFQNRLKGFKVCVNIGQDRELHSR